MNFLKNVRVTTIFTTTSGTLGTTGDAVAESTAGSSGDGTTTKGGFPFYSTGLDMSGFEGVAFIATMQGTSAAGATLKAVYSAVSSTVAGSAYTDFPTAYITTATASTVYDTLVLDLVRPTKRFVAAAVQLSATSATVAGIIAIQYGNEKNPVTSLSTAYSVGGVNTVVGATA